MYNIIKCCYSTIHKAKINRILNSINLEDLERLIKIRNITYPLDDFKRFYNLYKIGYNEDIYNEFYDLLERLPNNVDSTTPIGPELKGKVLKIVGSQDLKKNAAHNLGKQQQFLRLEDVAAGAEGRAYYFIGDLVRLERALARFTLQKLIRFGWDLVTVGDVIAESAVQKCGFVIDRSRNQVYNTVTGELGVRSLFQQEQYDPKLGGVCLSGTAEMALVCHLSDHRLHASKDLPLRLTALSRCFRREVSQLENHLYRVHQFDKVEMFAAATPNDSERIFDEIVSMQQEIFTELGLNFRVIQVATEELGNPATKKIDIEAWMPGQGLYGEISSSSVCTDYQARRTNIQMITNDDNDCYDNSEEKFPYTLNGTACAIPRVVKAIIETHQDERNQVWVPEVLQPFMGGLKRLSRPEPHHRVVWIDRVQDRI